MLKKVDLMEKTISNKDKKIEELEEKVNTLEQYLRTNNVIIKGLSLEKLPQTYANVANRSQPNKLPARP